MKFSIIYHPPDVYIIWLEWFRNVFVSILEIRTINTLVAKTRNYLTKLEQ